MALKMIAQGRTTRYGVLVAALAGLSACAVPARMHDVTELNAIGTRCGLALGELIQDEAEKKLLLMIRQSPTVAQRACVAQWARANHLKAVFVAMDFAS